MPLIAYGQTLAVAIVLPLMWAAVTTILALLPDHTFPRTRLDPVIPHRYTAMGRVTFLALLYGALSAVQLAGWGPAWAYFGLLWMVPLFTTFPLFMILRQWVQHGNADRGRYTNTRVFLVGPLVRYAVFPWGMDYHLPHHLMASVPHFNLKQLHEIMLRDPEYREKGVVVEGYFGTRPTGRRGVRPRWACWARRMRPSAWSRPTSTTRRSSTPTSPIAAGIAREVEASLRRGN